MKRKQWVAASLSAAMISSLLLSGCTSSASEASSVGSGETAAEPTELTVFIDYDWFWMDDFGGRPVDDEITRLSGVKLNIIKATDAQQLPVMIASGSLPDIVYSQNFSELSSDNVCYEMGELLATYTPDFKPPTEQIASAMNEDGKYYYLVNFWQNETDWEDPHFLPGVGNKGFIYRQDIYEAIGSPKMETLEDLENVLRLVHEKYPDMVPLALYSEGNKYDMFVNQSVLQPGTTDIVQQEDGSWKYFATTDAYHQGMQTLFNFAQEGLLQANMFTLKYDQYIAEAQQGNVFMWVDDASNAALYNSAFAAAGLEGASTQMLDGSFFDDPEPVIDTAAGWCGTFVTKNCKDPEAAAKFLQWCSTDEASKLVGWGIEGVHYNEDENGYPVLTPEIAESWNKDYDATVRETGIGCWFFGTRSWYESVRTYDPESNPELTEWLVAFKENMDVRPELATLRPESGSDAATAQVQLQTLVTSYYPQIIFAKDQSEFDSLYSELQSQIAAQGGVEYEEWANSKWASIQQQLGL